MTLIIGKLYKTKQKLYPKTKLIIMPESAIFILLGIVEGDVDGYFVIEFLYNNRIENLCFWNLKDCMLYIEAI